MRNSLILYFLLIIPLLQAQVIPDPISLPQYNFIHYNSNLFELTQNNPSYNTLFTQFDSLLKSGGNQIKIVHIGGSHIQADIYTHRIRQELQSFYPGILGSRGFFFPYKLAKTNSPSNLWIRYTGEWLTSKNTQPEPLYTLGVSGITCELESPTGSLKIVANYDTIRHYDFNRIRLFCNISSVDQIPKIYPKELVRSASINQAGQFIQYDLASYADTLHVFIDQSDSLAVPFQLYGISLENDDPGVIYNSIGVNGAMLKSYLRCGLFSKQLIALDPDWVILSIGTNEGNTRSFDKESYRNEYIRLIDSIKLAVPHAAILLTVPNDCYLNKRYINYNTAAIREIIFDLANNYGCGVWDFYSIMGGLNSAKNWFDHGLMSKDHIHFNKPGYLLKGDLFYSAFLTSWNIFTQSTMRMPPYRVSTQPDGNQTSEMVHPAINTELPSHD